MKEVIEKRASIDALKKTLGHPEPPKKITQNPFDYDPGHYARLCNLKGSPPEISDLCDYALDMTYEELQPDLLQYLWPILLEAWREDMYKENYEGFGENFWTALRESGCATGAIVRFMRDSILDRMDTETDLHFAGKPASPYAWVDAINGYAAVFNDFNLLWSEWWREETPGHAICLLQYCSALLYKSNSNPVFEPWTPDKGGGPPCVWEQPVHSINAGWIEENVKFIEETLTIDAVNAGCVNAATLLANSTVGITAATIVESLPACQSLLEPRIKELPLFLRSPTMRFKFTI